MAVSDIDYGPGVAPDTAGWVTRRAASRLGVAPRRLSGYHQNFAFVSADNLGTFSTSGTVGAVNSYTDGSSFGLTAGTALLQGNVLYTTDAQFASGGGGTVAMVANWRTSKFYTAWYGRMITAYNAGAICAGVLVLGAGGNRTYIGVNNNASATKFAVRTDGATNIASTVSIDTTRHTFEFWSDGTTTYFSVDDEVPVTGVSSDLANTAGHFGLQVQQEDIGTAQVEGEFSWWSMFAVVPTS